MNAFVLTLVATALAGPLQDDAPTTPPSGQGLRIDRGIVTLIDDINVPAREAGLLNELMVTEGDEVQAGTLLGKLDKADALTAQSIAGIEVTIAQRQAESTVEVDAAFKAAEVSKAELAESNSINVAAPGTVPTTQLRRETLTMERAELQHQAAIIQHSVAKDTHNLRNAELDAATNRVNRHDVRSPVDGVVAQVIRRPGNWLQPGEPVLRIVRMDRLRVEGMVYIGDLEQEIEGASPGQVLARPATVTVDCGVEGVKEFKGIVNFVSPLVEANGKYRIGVEIENVKTGNYWAIRPGLEATLDIELGDSPKE